MNDRSAPPGRDGPPPAISRNGFAIAGFVLGMVGLIFSLIPVIGLVAWPLVILGVVFGTLGLLRVRRSSAPHASLAVIGVVLSALGLIVCVAWTAGVASFVGRDARDVTDVRYEVTGTATDPTITYSTSGDDGSATDQESATALPWSKDIQIRGTLKASALTITTGAGGGTITCAVIVNGRTTRSSTASGPFAVASCDGF